MVDKKNIIGVCATRVQGEFCKAYLDALFKYAREAGFRVCVFQSVYDFDDTDERGAAFVFENIPYDNITALVILHETIYDKELLNRIIDKAVAKDVPVIMARNADPRCYSIIGNFAKTYEELITKILLDRGIKDVFYIGGREKSGVDSRERIDIFKRVTEKLEIPFDDSKIAYGEFYEKPVVQIIDKLVAGGNKPPKAIFCANDIMAMAACNRLAYYGYSVPNDTIVVGFDGLECAQYSKPKLATLSENLDSVAKITISLIEDALKGAEICTIRYEYLPCYSESAGYDDDTSDQENIGNEIFRRFRADEADEDRYNEWIDAVVENQSLDGLRNVLPWIVDKERKFVIRQDPFWEMQDERARNRLPRKLLLLSQDDLGRNHQKEVTLSEALTTILGSIPDDKIGYLSAISMNDMVYGLAMTTTRDPFNAGGRMNRFAFSLDRGFSLAVAGEKQAFLAEQVNRNRHLDPITNMFNMDGAGHWFDGFKGSEKAANTYLTVGVYTLISYQAFIDGFGYEFLEDCLQFMANTLVLVNPEKEMIARISADSFVVVTAYDEGVESAEIIDESIQAFYQVLEMKKANNPSWSEMEVSCGYSFSDVGISNSLADYINSSISTLYRNRATLHRKLPEGIDKKDGMALFEYKSRFFDLLKQNKFVYHFQPIVDTYTGEIVAYEGLMRTEADIQMNPMEVLSAAEMFGKRDDVEYATFYNIFKRIRDDGDSFVGRKIFINTIPGSFLTKKRIDDLVNEFGWLLTKAVIEITETETIDKEELEAIRGLCGINFETPIAVDDYGTGHSNIVNLLEYMPQVVKIDRYLISGVDKDLNKQMFVKNLLEFAKVNNIRVLAEGVETREELKTVIEYGVDLVQGYYTAKPAYEVMQKLPDVILNEIIEFRKNREEEVN